MRPPARFAVHPGNNRIWNRPRNAVFYERVTFAAGRSAQDGSMATPCHHIPYDNQSPIIFASFSHAHRHCYTE